ncbi:hypothetical protein PHYPSEUDO_005797 [Phytophthora pseudosyringae]|uniref:Uncharacterized protein n=1 Tax=Phytophthora pseudosyringae TaxID=221518 RepID=A0A8T1VNA1_9STRA|nr:hypothetical protein PHYPSEUDO_005797 [Phytophthora pseudosyringae]
MFWTAKNPAAGRFFKSSFAIDAVVDHSAANRTNRSVGSNVSTLLKANHEQFLSDDDKVQVKTREPEATVLDLPSSLTAICHSSALDGELRRDAAQTAHATLNSI